MVDSIILDQNIVTFGKSIYQKKWVFRSGYHVVYM
jgi:hypothetical protein